MSKENKVTVNSLLSDLTDSQKEAVTHEGSPLLVIAGPGSGKTEVLARRVAFFVLEKSIKPENILAVTFTEKAAYGLKDRIQKKLPKVNADLMQISTIHSFCAGLLREYSDFSVLAKGFNILDEIGQFLFIFSNRKKLGLSEIAKGRPARFFEAVTRYFNLATEEMVDPASLLSWCETSSNSCPLEEKNLWKERTLISEAYRQYVKLLLEKRLIDFSHLQSNALKVMKDHPKILGDLQSRYPFIVIDEYQDTNAVQDEIFRLLSKDGRQLTVVGDDDQSIYRFRGATVKNIINFSSKYGNTHIVRLTKNFRSPDQIVNSSKKLISHNPERFSKDLQSARGLGNEVTLVYEHSASEEAQSIAKIIKHLIQARKIKKYSDVCILLRSVRSYSEPYKEALESLGIPYQISGDASLFEKAEINQMYELFNFLGASKEWGDRFIRNSVVNLDEKTCDILKKYKKNLLELRDEDDFKKIGLKNKADRVRIIKLLELKRKVQKQDYRTALQIYYDLLSITEYTRRLERNGQKQELANLGLLSQVISAWDEHSLTKNYYQFREYLEILKEGGVDPVIVPLEGAAQIMTIHQAKGLEFPVVVLGSAMDGRIPTIHRKDPYDIPYDLRASGKPEVSEPHLIDERKLFYVAATRARDLLIIGTADVVNKRGGGPSPFLREMLGHEIKRNQRLTIRIIKDIESKPLARLLPRPRYAFSQLAYYLQCPLRYRFCYIYGFASPWLDPVYFGLNMHRCLEDIHLKAMKGTVTEIKDLKKIVDDVWISKPFVAKEVEESSRQAAIKQLGQYLSRQSAGFASIVGVETKFSTEVDGKLFLGKIDLMKNVNGVDLEIIDFKSSASDPKETEQIELQLSLYALGIKSQFDKPIKKASAYFLGDGKTTSWDWHSGKEELAKNRLIEIIDKIENQEFLARKEYCIFCDEYKNICLYSS